MIVEDFSRAERVDKMTARYILRGAIGGVVGIQPSIPRWLLCTAPDPVTQLYLWGNDEISPARYARYRYRPGQLWGWVVVYADTNSLSNAYTHADPNSFADAHAQLSNIQRFDR